MDHPRARGASCFGEPSCFCDHFRNAATSLESFRQPDVPASDSSTRLPAPMHGSGAIAVASSGVVEHYHLGPMSSNASMRRRPSSCNDLGESLLHASSDAHALPAVQGHLDRVISPGQILCFWKEPSAYNAALFLVYHAWHSVPLVAINSDDCKRQAVPEHGVLIHHNCICGEP